MWIAIFENVKDLHTGNIDLNNKPPVFRQLKRAQMRGASMFSSNKQKRRFVCLIVR